MGFQKWAKNVTKEAIVPAFLLYTVLFIVGLGLMCMDIVSTQRGYALVPTQKVNPFLETWAVALIPTIGQIALGYAYLDDQTKRKELLVAGVLFSVDLFTDVFFKIGGSGTPKQWLIAGVESFFIYFVFSEMLVTFSFGMLKKTWKPAFDELGKGAKILSGDIRGFLFPEATPTAKPSVAVKHNNNGNKQNKVNPTQYPKPFPQDKAMEDILRFRADNDNRGK
jgi:hypothetical protein